MLGPHGTNYIFTVIITMPEKKMTKLTLPKSDKKHCVRNIETTFIYSSNIPFLSVFASH